MARNASSKKADSSLEGTPKKEQKPKPSGHKGGAGTAHAEGRSGSAGAGREGSTSQRSTNR